VILTWMLAAVLFGLLVGVAARALESAARLTSWQGRAPWVAAIGISVGWPVLGTLIARQRATVLPRVVVNSGAVQTIGRGLPALPRAVASSVDTALIVLWAAATLLLVARLLRAHLALSKISRAARSTDIDGHPVLVTDDIGPAVVGITAPRIAVPAWLAELDAPLRDLVLRHEREHCRARDTILLWLGEVAVVLMPWNPAIWWQSRRLRLALELDCDARTLPDREASATYGKLLLLIAQRQQMTRLAPMLAESNSHLSQRINAMSRQPVSNRRVRAALFGVVAVGAIAAACSSRVASDLTSPRPIGGKLAATALEPARKGVYF
jgi:beta-lactamase regulating signal transducer with metallopeptidase domain